MENGIIQKTIIAFAMLTGQSIQQDFLIKQSQKSVSRKHPHSQNWCQNEPAPTHSPEPPPSSRPKPESRAEVLRLRLPNSPKASPNLPQALPPRVQAERPVHRPLPLRRPRLRKPEAENEVILIVVYKK